MQIAKILSGKGSLFNITPNEYGRVIPAFLVKLFYHMALVSGGTILVALFVGRYSTHELPQMYIIQALFVILGTWLLSGALRKISPRYLIVGGSTIAAFLLLVSVHYTDSPLIFFGLALVAISIFLAQIGIWISLFIENIFSPLEGERVLPVIESAEPIGGILAGVLIVILIDKMNVELMFGPVGLLLLLIPPIIIGFIGHLNTFPVLQTKANQKSKPLRLEVVRNFRQIINRNRFLAGLFAVVFLQYAAYHIIEFEYTKKMDERSHHVVYSEVATYGPLPIEQIKKQDSEHVATLIHGLGSVHIIIHLLLLIVQLLFASSLLHRIGVMRTFTATPIMQFFSFISMLASFNIFTVLLAKGTYEISQGVGKSAFVNTFYAFPETIRDEAKELLDGVAKPLGLLIGTLFIIVAQLLFTEAQMHFVMNTCLVLMALACCALLINLTKHYTLITRKKYNIPNNIVEKMDAIEIMSQPGHKGSLDFLTEKLGDKQALPEVRIKILQVLGRMQKPNAIPAILDAFEDENPNIRLEAVKALSKFLDLGTKYFSQAFSRHRVQTSLRNIYMKSKNKELKIAAIKVFANLNDPDIIPFLIDILHTNDSELCAESISVCGLFHDAGTIVHLTPFLEHEHPKVRSAAIIALWQFPHQRIVLVGKMSEMLRSSQIEELRFGIYCAGSTRAIQEKSYLLKLLVHEDEAIRRHSAIALAKLNEYHVVETLVEFLFHQKKEVGHRTKELICELEKKYQQRVQERSLQEVAHRVTKILKQSETTLLEHLPHASLTELLHLFELVNAEREVWTIRMIMYNREKAELNQTGVIACPRL